MAFTTPAKSLPDLDATATATLIAAAADLSLVLDERGVIQDVSFQNPQLARDLDVQARWLGRPWIDTVLPDSRAKVGLLLREAAAAAAPRWRHLNHPAGDHGQVPILYSAVRLGDGGELVAFGRDLRPESELQARLVTAQQSLEHDYARLRNVEMRYRLLFQMSTEAVLILDAATLKVTEANPAAHRLFGKNARRLLGRPLPLAFDAAGGVAVQSLLDTARVVGRAEDLRAHLAETDAANPGRGVTVSAALFREDLATLFLVRLSNDAVDAADRPAASRSQLLSLIEHAPDGFVVIAGDGRIVTANVAFLELAELAREEQARGEKLDRWLGRDGVTVDVLMSNLRQRGTVRLFATVMRGEYGAAADVEVSAAAMGEGGTAGFGLAIRNVGRRLATGPDPALPRPAQDLTELVGRVAMKELVRQSTDVIERLCIEAALKLTGDNRAAAAEMLGLSRQSLYVKLRRHGLGDLAGDAEPD